MNSRKFYRDSIEETITGPIKVSVTSDGHTVERYTLVDGTKRYFVTLAGTHWSAHGTSIANAVADALWKDPSKRPPMQALIDEMKRDGLSRKINLNEFRLLTGACRLGCLAALEKVGRDETPLTAHEIRDIVSAEWGNKLLALLGWEAVTS